MSRLFTWEKNSPVQVRFAEGSTLEAKSFLPLINKQPKVPIVAWRYITGPDQ
jgi:hypothetical protein